MGVVYVNDTDRKTTQEDNYREKLERYTSEQLDEERKEIKNRIKYLNQSLSKVITREEIVEQQKVNLTNKVPQQEIEMGQISKKPVPAPSSKANQYRVIPGLVSDSSKDKSSAITYKLNRATVLEELSGLKKQLSSNDESMIKKEEEINTLKRINEEEIKTKESILKSNDELMIKKEEEINTLKRINEEEINTLKRINEEEINRLKRINEEEIKTKESIIKSNDELM